VQAVTHVALLLHLAAHKFPVGEQPMKLQALVASFICPADNVTAIKLKAVE
jgi:hypothetical protein